MFGVDVFACPPLKNLGGFPVHLTGLPETYGNKNNLGISVTRVGTSGKTLSTLTPPFFIIYDVSFAVTEPEF